MELKTPPHSPEAEAGVLGSFLLDPLKFSTVQMVADDFYDPRNQHLYTAMMELETSGAAWCVLSLGERLKRTGKLEKVGGYDYLASLQEATLVPSHATHYASLVKEKRLLRSIIEKSMLAVESAYRGESDGIDVLNNEIAELHSLCRMEKEQKTLSQMAHEFIKDCETGSVGHFPWWCDEWTRKMGMLSDELVILHARRSTGKTAITLQWIEHAYACGQIAPLRSIETQAARLVPRIIANLGQVNTFTMRTRGSITSDEKQKATRIADALDTMHLEIQDGGASIDDILTWGYSMARKYEGGDRRLGAIFVDNMLSISDGGKKFDSKPLMYDHFMRKFRDLRDHLKVPIIILAHPNAEGQVAWSKDTENFADIILFLQDGKDAPDWVVEPSADEIMGKWVVALFQKNRDGIMSVGNLDFIGSTQTFFHRGWGV